METSRCSPGYLLKCIWILGSGWKPRNSMGIRTASKNLGNLQRPARERGRECMIHLLFTYSQGNGYRAAECRGNPIGQGLKQKETLYTIMPRNGSSFLIYLTTALGCVSENRKTISIDPIQIPTEARVAFPDFYEHTGVTGRIIAIHQSSLGFFRSSTGRISKRITTVDQAISHSTVTRGSEGSFRVLRICLNEELCH